MKTPEESWQEVRDQAFDGEIPPEQEQACSSCFYAGMLEMLKNLVVITETRDPNVSWPEAVSEYQDQVIAAGRQANKSR